MDSARLLTFNTKVSGGIKDGGPAPLIVGPPRDFHMSH